MPNIVVDGYLPFPILKPNDPPPSGEPFVENPSLRVEGTGQQATISTLNANFGLQADRKVLFGGNGQISAAGDISFLTGATSPTEQMKIFANGNIGIGIGATPPTNKLEVNGKIKATDLEVSGTVTAKNFVGEIAGLNDKVSKAGDTITGALTVENALTVNGNLGIGKPAAKEKLEVVGKIKATELLVDGTVTANRFVGEIAGLTDSLDSKINKTGDTVNGSLEIQNNLTVSGNLKLQNVTVNKFSSDATLNGNSDLTIPTEKAVKTYVDSRVGQIPSSQWSKSGANLVYTVANSNVGIGTNQPSAKLEVAGNFKLQIGVAVNQFSSDTNLGDSDQAVPTQKAVKTYVNSKLTGGSSQWSDGTDNSISYAKGNVGIGTSKPGGALHIFSRPSENDPTSGGYIKFFDKTSSWQYECSYDGGSDGSFNFTNLGSDSGQTRFQTPKKVLLTIKNNGDVSGQVAQPSSRELKENITDFSAQEAIKALANLNPVKFNYREDNQKQLKAGFIAEDVPELVATADRKAIYAIDIVAVLTKVIQQQQEELSCLKERLNALEARA